MSNDWDSSTASPFLSGENDVPAQGLEGTIIGIRTEMMEGLNNTGQEMKFIASFNEPHIKPGILNKTNRKILKDQCGVTNGNVSGPLSIPVRIMQNHTNMGIGFLLAPRQVATAAPVAPAAQPVAPPAAVAPPAVGDDVPF